MQQIEESKAIVNVDGQQAGQQLDSLQQKARELRKEIIEVNKQSVIDYKKLHFLNEELKLTKQEINSVKKSTFDYQKVLSNLSGASLRELEKLASKLNFEIKGMSRNTDQYKKSAGDLSRVRAEIAKVKQELSAAGVQTRTFGDRLSNIGANMFAATGIIGGFTALYSVVSKAFTTIKEFASGISELKAITGASGDDLEYLKQKAKDMSAQYGTSAREVVNAMKMVGSAKPELLSNVRALGEVTDAVLTLSKASRMDLQTSTASLTTIMNQFGHAASDANTDINILAAGSKYGAVEVDYLAESISKVGTIADSAGLTLEQTTAVMELFGEKGVKAETAGRGFKSILVELQSDTKNYTNGVFDLNKAIDRNKSISTDNIALQQKFGQEFFGLAQILLQNSERFAELTKQVTGTNVAFEQASIQMDNLQGDLDKFGGAWDKFVLNVDEGDGFISKSLRRVIQGFTDFINALGDLNSNQTSFAQKTQIWADYMGQIFFGLDDSVRKFWEGYKKLFGETDLTTTQAQRDAELKARFGDDKDFQERLKLAKERGIAAAHAEIEERKKKNEDAKKLGQQLTDDEKRNGKDEKIRRLKPPKT